jgi:nucleoside phosphorylase
MRRSSTASSSVTSAIVPQQAPAPTPAIALDPVGVITGMASNLFRTVLNPLATSKAPGVPADTPTLWSLLAFARREFETAFAPPSLTDTRANVQKTGQALAAETKPSGMHGVQPEQRTLVLTAFPAEADAILARTTLDPDPSVVVDGHHFYLGSVGGKKVIVAMTGIGMVNSGQTTETALAHFTPESGISIGAVVFVGVAGGSGRTEIGSVAVPARWTSDDGATWRAVDTGMLAAANTLTVDLLSTDSIGDPACHICGPLARFPLIDLHREPQLFVGGDGSTDDNNNGTAFPEIPLGGAILGPQPLRAPDFSPLFTGNFFSALGPFLINGLLSNILGFLTMTNPPVDAVDQETAAAQQVADAHGVPFLGIRGMSDGPGDRLNLPGYPFTFFVYKQIAADNAAIVTEAFLHSWAGA